jgi:hypothetical protein
MKRLDKILLQRYYLGSVYNSNSKRSFSILKNGADVSNRIQRILDSSSSPPATATTLITQPSSTSSSSAIDNNIATKAKKKQKGPLTFASQAQALLAIASDTDREVAVSSRKRKAVVADNPHLQAVHEGFCCLLLFIFKPHYIDTTSNHSLQR